MLIRTELWPTPNSLNFSSSAHKNQQAFSKQNQAISDQLKHWFFYHSGGFWDPSRDFPLPNRTEESFTLISSWTCFSSIYFTCTSSSCCRFCLPYLLFICPALNGIPLKSAWSWCLVFGRSFCVLYCPSASFALKDLIFPVGSVGQWWCYMLYAICVWPATQSLIHSLSHSVSCNVVVNAMPTPPHFASEPIPSPFPLASSICGSKGLLRSSTCRHCLVFVFVDKWSRFGPYFLRFSMWRWMANVGNVIMSMILMDYERSLELNEVMVSSNVVQTKGLQFMFYEYKQ